MPLQYPGLSRRHHTGEGCTDHNVPNHLTVPRQAGKLAVLLDALDGLVISSAERASLTWLAGFEEATVENIVVVITHARRTR